MAEINVEGQPGGEPGGQPAQWYQGAEVLKGTDPEIWQSFENGVKSGSIKDLPTFIKNHVNLEKRMGTAVSLPGKDAKPEERAAVLSKLRSAGLLPNVPESPDKYELNLDSIPENIRAPELINEFKKFAHENGLSPEVANGLLELNAKQFNLANQLFEGSKAEAEARIMELAKADGRDMNAVMEGGKRAAEHFLRQSPKTLEKLNTLLGNDPDIMYALSKMGEALGEDTSETGEAASAAEAAFEEVKRIRTDPNHPDHKAWLAENGRGPINDKIEAAYNKRYPGTANLG